MAERLSTSSSSEPPLPVYIYALTNQDGQVRYVGKTIHIPRRLYHHLYYAKRGLSGRRYRWIRAELALGRSIKLLRLETATESNWEEREQFWIRRYRRSGTKLLNQTDGGEGVHGFKQRFSAQWRAEQSERCKRLFAGKPQTAEHRRHISEGQSRRRGVVQLTAGGAVISEYTSIKEAAKALGVFHGSINAAIQWPSRRSCKGFKWAYRDCLPAELGLWVDLRDYMPTPTTTYHPRHHSRSGMTAADVRDIRSRYRRGLQLPLAREYGVSIDTISRIVRRETWRHVA